MEEKHKDLVANKQKELIDRLVTDLNQSNPSFYYQSASDIAHEIRALIKEKKNLSQEEFLLLDPLDRRDIQLVLSFH